MVDTSEILVQLDGTWKLAACEEIALDGAVNFPLGQDARGQLIYDTKKMRVSVHIVRANQPKFASNDWRQATTQEMSSAWPNYFGYFGTFAIDGDSSTVVHRIESGWFPNLVGTEQTRHYQLSGNDLILDADTDWGKIRNIWQKEN